MKCTMCGDTGFLKKLNPQGLEEGIICECRRSIIDKQILNAQLKEGNFPLQYWDYELKYYEDNADANKIGRAKTEIISNIKNIDLFINSKMHLWLYGSESNACHTSLAVILCKELLKKDLKAKFIAFRKLLDLFIDFENKRTILDSYLRTNYILIDDMLDLNRATIKQYQAINLYGFIQDCIDNNITFIFTSNINLNAINDPMFQEIKAILSAKVYSIHLRGL